MPKRPSLAASIEHLVGGAGGNRNTEICPGRPSGPLAPVDSTMCVCRVGLCPSGGVHSVQRSVQREDGLFGDTNDVAGSGEEQFNLDTLHRGGVPDVEQCIDHVLLGSAVAPEVLEVVSIWRDD